MSCRLIENKLLKSTFTLIITFVQRGLTLLIQQVYLQHPHPLAHIWAQGTPKNHISPEMRFQKGRKVDWRQKMDHFFALSP